MKTFLECVPCLVRQAWEAVSMATDDPAVQESVLREAVRMVADVRMDQSPPHMAAGIHKMIRRRLDWQDPYGDIKSRSNQAALALLDEMEVLVHASDNPFAMSVRLSIIGNVIDFGAPDRPPLDDLLALVHDNLQAPIDEDACHSLQNAVESAETVLVVGDNAGEIVFDRLLLAQCTYDKCIFGVKGTSVINDATVEDAHEAGLDGLVEVIGNGTDVPGTVLEYCSPTFVQQFQDADVVIAKGQGNYETLSGVPRPNLYFLLKAKCPVIARHIGCRVGDFVIQSTKGETHA